MSGNYPYFQVTDLTVSDTTVKSGEKVTVTVKFTCSGDPQGEWYCNHNWPYTAKIYLEGFGTSAEQQWTSSGKLNPGVEEYEKDIEIGPLTGEGIREVGALVELDDDAGFVMGHYDGDLKLSVWTAV